MKGSKAPVSCQDLLRGLVVVLVLSMVVGHSIKKGLNI